MLKRLCLAFAGLFAWLSVAQGAGTVPGFSLVPQFDLSGKIAPGCRLYVIQAGTVSTPQNAYQDSGLTLAQPNPMTCDAAGRLPQWFVADGNIKLRLTDKNGVQIFSQDGLLVVGASSGGGGGSPVDPTAILSTGDMKIVYNVGILSGFVRCNGRTIGGATSGATERANADTSALFSFLWSADPNLAVSGGRGASAAADFSANKTITLPDCRGRDLAGLDDMGNSAAGRLTSTYFGTGATTLGASGGSQSHALTVAEHATLTSTGAITVTPGVGVSLAGSTSGFVSTSYQTGASISAVNSNGATVSNVTSLTGSNSLTTTGTGGTTGAAHSIVPPTILTTIYIKL